MRRNPSGYPRKLYSVKPKIVNLNLDQNGPYYLILDKNSTVHIIDTYSDVEVGGTMTAFWIAALPLTGMILGWTIRWLYARFQLASAERQAERIKRDAAKEAESQTKEMLVEAKDQIIRERNQQEREIRERRAELQRYERRVQQKEETLDKKIETLDRQEQTLQTRLKAATDKEEALAGQEERYRVELERISGLSADEAKKLIIQGLENEARHDAQIIINKIEQEAQLSAERRSRDILVTTIQRIATEVTTEVTVTSVSLPSDEMKGRIIGREGRNIRAIETLTGVDLIIDDTPEAVVLSSFDPIRREIARVALERLIADGRIHPTRIEEMVEKVTKEMDADLQKCGQEVVERLRLAGVKPALVKLLGRLKYRYSFSQNVLAHSEEVAGFMGAIAAQLGLDEQKARRIGLFHDIGKAVDHEIEGSHAVIGMDLLKRHGEDDESAQAVGCHHEDIECNSLYGALVKICDKLSASRPGARSETTELYLKRLEQLETIGLSFPGVESCYAIQAGRELRVLVVPEKISESQAAVLARDAAQKIEKEMRYPGQIKVTVIRETRASDLAK